MNHFFSAISAFGLQAGYTAGNTKQALLIPCYTDRTFSHIVKC